MTSRRILYVQYTNPGGYPPLLNSARILADRGHSVRFFGVRNPEAHSLDVPPHPNIRVRLWHAQAPGMTQKLHYVAFQKLALLEAMAWRPHWLYLSDPLSAPVGLAAARLGFHVLYHEHDEPTPESLNRLIRAARRELGRRASVVVIPNEERLEAFRRDVDRQGPDFCVWNCPLRETIPAELPPFPEKSLRVLFQGSLSEVRFPRAVVKALTHLPEWVTLEVMGYSTGGVHGYPAELKKLADSLGVGGRLKFHPLIPHHDDVLKETARCQVGLALFSRRSRDPNLTRMAGASNKVFEYLGRGLIPLVADTPEWRRLLVEPGLALPCEPDDEASLAAQLRWILDHPEERERMRRAGWKRCLDDWHYESRFRPVLERLEAGGS